ncbi:MAG: response regulator [Gammaproteobacteria bacterium]
MLNYTYDTTSKSSKLMEQYLAADSHHLEPAVHILVVDDDLQTRQLIADYLGTQAYRVSTAADGWEMAGKLAASAVDLIVLDVRLPGEDGLSLARKLRAESIS